MSNCKHGAPGTCWDCYNELEGRFLKLEEKYIALKGKKVEEPIDVLIKRLRSEANFVQVGPWPNVMHDSRIPGGTFGPGERVLLLGVSLEPVFLVGDNDLSENVIESGSCRPGQICPKENP